MQPMRAAPLGKWRMAKGLTILAMAVAGLILLLFALDLAIGFPFAKASMMMDVIFVVCATILGYLGWSAFKDQV
jgi:hypothetical protein